MLPATPSLGIADSLLASAGRMLGLPEDLDELLRHPKRELTVSLPVTTVSGTYRPVTGKPIAVGGSLGRREATSRGVFSALHEAMAEVFPGKPAGEIRVAIQGFGNVGSNLARILHEEGFRLIALSDVHGGIRSDSGIDVPAALDYSASGGSIAGMPGCEEIDNQQLLAGPC